MRASSGHDASGVSPRNRQAELLDTPVSSADRLDSWKQIAAYLNRSVLTAQRWEKLEGLPVHRHAHEKQASVYAFKSELDSWQRNRGVETPGKAATKWQLAIQRLGTLSRLSSSRRVLTAALLLAGAALVFALAGTTWMRVGHASILVPRRVVVGTFENHTGDSALDPLSTIATDWLTDGVHRIEGIEVVPAKSTLSRRSSAITARNLAEETGAGTVVAGNYLVRSDSLVFHAQMIDGHTGRLIRPLDEVTGPSSAAMDVIQALRARVVGAIAQTFHASPHAAEGGSPPTFAAYLKYLEGYRLANEFRYTEAIPRLEAAVALDSTFLGAWFTKADVHYNFAAVTAATAGFGQPEVLRQFAKGDSARLLLERARDRLNPAQRHYLDWQDAMREGELGRGRRALRELIAIAPDPSVRSMEGLIDLRLNLPREAIEALRLAGDASPFRAEAYHLIASHELELKEAQRLRDLRPGLHQTVAVELMALAALGRDTELMNRLDESLAFASQPGWWTYGSVAAITALELRAHGHAEPANAVFQRAIEWYRAKESPISRSDMYGLARTLYWSGEWREARQLFAQLSAESPGDLDYLGYLGVASARVGDRPEALRIEQRLADFKRPFPLFGHPSLWRARIAATLGAREQSVARLREAIRQGLLPLDVAQGWGYAMWLHRDVDFEALRDFLPFRALINPESRD
jgi:TolB-like protein